MRTSTGGCELDRLRAEVMPALKTRVPAIGPPFLLRIPKSQPGKKGWDLGVLSAGAPHGAGPRRFLALGRRPGLEPAVSAREPGTSAIDPHHFDHLRIVENPARRNHANAQNRPASKRMPAEFRRNARERHGRPANGRETCAYRARSTSFQRQIQGRHAQTQLLTSAIVAMRRIPTAFRQPSADNGKTPSHRSGIPCPHHDQRPHTYHRP